MQAVGDDRTMYSEGVTDACSTKCVVEGVITVVGPGKAVKAAKEAGVLGAVADKFFARGTGWFNSNDYFRVGYGWKGTAQDGRTVFRVAVGNSRAVVRFLGKEIKIHWHFP